MPLPENLSEYVKDVELAKVLGKTFFWDKQAGSDGQVACATCHYHAGVDNRIRNTVNPGPDGEFDLPYWDRPDQFLDPLHFILPQDSAIDDVVGSQGVERMDFVKIVPGSKVDEGIRVSDPIFGHSRRVTGRQAPTVINAIFNFRSFWDGRAENCFNGVDNSGWRNANAMVRRSDSEGNIEYVSVDLKNASVASQAVAPLNNDTEMAWMGRSFPEVAQKLLSLTPLGAQWVDNQDSLLGPYRKNWGLSVSYEWLVQQAFHEEFWNSGATFDKAGNLDPAGDFSLMESN